MQIDITKKELQPISILKRHNGDIIQPSHLPKVNCRWTWARKLDLVLCIEAKFISIIEACDRYLLSHDELLSWVNAHETKVKHQATKVRS
jgi:hypothetical protein